MLQLPPIPPWESLHPLLIHFPIVLLLVSPLFILIGVVRGSSRGKPYLMAALILLLLGTISLFLSVETGEATAELVDQTPPVRALLQSHQNLAEDTRNIFVALSLIGTAVLLLPRLIREDRVLFSRVLPLCFLVFYVVGMLFLVNTADRGGRLVHELGVHAVIAPTTERPAAPAVAAE